MKLNTNAKLRNLRLQQEISAVDEKREKRRDLFLWTAIAVLTWLYVAAEILNYVKG